VDPLRAAALILVATLPACGRSTTVRSGPPARIVTLTPSSTELVAALGAADRLVAVDAFSTYPPEVAALPRVGDFVSPSFEAIVALDPDLVVLDQVQDKLAPVLRAAGIRTVALDIQAIGDVRGGLVELGDALGRRSQAEAAVAAIDADIEAASARGRARGRHARVLTIIDRSPGAIGRMVAAGPGAWVDQLLAITGAASAVADAGTRYVKIGPEDVLRTQPEVVIEVTRPGQEDRVRREWAAFSGIPATRDGRIYAITDSVFTAPTPRIAEALRTLERILDEP